MAYRSNFPTEIDSFLEHYELQAYDLPKVARFQDLKMKVNRTPQEELELTNLTTELRDKMISAEDFNKFQDALVSMQIFIRDNVTGYINTMKTDVQNFTNNAKADMTNTKEVYTGFVEQKETDIQTFTNQKKNEIQNILDQTTAGQLNNRIESITGERVIYFFEEDANGNLIYIFGVEEDFDLVVMLNNVSTIAQRNTIANPVENSLVYVTGERQVYKRINSRWNAVPKRKSVRYVWYNIDNQKSIEDAYFKSPVSKNTSVVQTQTSTTVKVGTNITEADFISGSTYLEVNGVKYKVNSIAKVLDSGNNHVSTNIVLNESVTSTSGANVYLITCQQDSMITTEFLYNGNSISGVKKKKV